MLSQPKRLAIKSSEWGITLAGRCKYQIIGNRHYLKFYLRFIEVLSEGNDDYFALLRFSTR